MTRLFPLLCTLLLALTACPPPPTENGDAQIPGKTDASTPKTDGSTPGEVDGSLPKTDGSIPGDVDGSVPGTPDGSTPGNPDGGLPPGEIEIRTCNTNLPTPPNGQTCETVAGDSKMLLTGTVLVPGVVYRGGQVLVENGKITCVDCDCSAKGAGATKITCPDAVVSPGLINTHDHITFASTAPFDVAIPKERFEHRHDWRKGKEGHTNIQSTYIKGGASADTVAFAELRFAMGGATSTVGSGNAAGFLRNLDSSNQEGLGQTPVEFETFPLGDSSGTLVTSGCGYSFNDPSWNSLDAYLPHVGEGINQAAHNEFLCLEGTSGGGHDMVNNKTSFIHGIAGRPSDAQAMQKDGARLIWSPRSNVSLYGDTASVPMYARMGVLVALGTDWLPSGSMNLLRELKCAADLNDTYFDHFFSDEGIWLMVTANAARATATDDVVGTLKAGLVADIAIFAKRGRVDHRAVIEAEPKDVAMVMRGGKVLFGDANVVSAFSDGGTCDTLDVCTVSKKVCAQREVGKSLSALTSSETSKYPLFKCNAAPDREPTCQPQRTCTSGCPVNASVNGSTVYDGLPKPGDQDGDGISDDQDNCPKVFNPIRPMDNGAQADEDNDGEGDACDVCPLAADRTDCPQFVSNDADGDGIVDAKDNCPNVANVDQADADADGKGDLCDACKNESNPGSQACSSTIYAVKDGTVKIGDAVALKNVLVTGLSSRGFFVQVKETDTGYNGADNSGVLCFLGAAPTVKVGDRVTIKTGTLADYYGEKELTSVEVVVDASNNEAAPQPTVVQPAEIATGGARAAALEAVLVQVNNVTVTNPNPTPAASDTSSPWEFEVTGALRVHDFIFHVPVKPAQGDTYTSITGILHFDHSNSKIEPRAAGDLVAGAPAPAKLAAIVPATGTLRAGLTNATTYNTPMAVTLVSPVSTATEVAVAVDAAAQADLQVVGGKVTVPAGQTSAPILFNSVNANAAVTVTATLGTDSATGTVKVLAADAAPSALTLSPATGSVTTGGKLTMTVAFDVPVAADTTVTLTVGTGGSAPATVQVANGQSSATFDFTGGASEATGVTVSASAGSLTSNTATIDVKAPALGTMIFSEYVEGSSNNKALEALQRHRRGRGPDDLPGEALHERRHHRGEHLDRHRVPRRGRDPGHLQLGRGGGRPAVQVHGQARRHQLQRRRRAGADLRRQARRLHRPGRHRPGQRVDRQQRLDARLDPAPQVHGRERRHDEQRRIRPVGRLGEPGHRHLRRAGLARLPVVG
ncbi:MAG: amidohydrolase family protein [Myxococcales bacterium]